VTVGSPRRSVDPLILLVATVHRFDRTTACEPQ